MNCPKCGAREVCYDSRQKGRDRWRRYKCPNCGEKRTTWEVPAKAMQAYSEIAVQSAKLFDLLEDLGVGL